MNTFTKIGLWIEKHFPERMIAEEVHKKFHDFQESLKSISVQHAVQETEIKSLLERIHGLEMLQEDVKKLKEEVNSLRTHNAIKMGIAGNQPMTPFASRIPNGGNKSPQ